MGAVGRLSPSPILPFSHSPVFPMLPSFPISQALGELAWDGVVITALDGVEQAEARLGEVGCAGERVWRLS